MACETKRELERMKLKDCPFCGGKAEISGGTVYCPVCEISFANERETGAEAIKEVAELWNARPIENELEAENKMLIGALKAIKKIVDKPPLSIYDAARIYAECCEALGEKNDA